MFDNIHKDYLLFNDTYNLFWLYIIVYLV
jgi:hypothetical protein